MVQSGIVRKFGKQDGFPKEPGTIVTKIRLTIWTIALVASAVDKRMPKGLDKRFVANCTAKGRR